MPAYMDLEQDLIDEIAVAAEGHSDSSRTSLVDVVRGVTVEEGDTFSLAKIVVATRAMPSQSLREPPCLAFLAVTVMAAEEMGKAGEGLAPHAYYARLARLLGLVDQDAALQKQYRQHAELLWKRVNKWLENLEGGRGIPTAFALTHRYVGLPISQALVRESDRRRLSFMFVQYGLSPGMRLAPEDLKPYLDMWLTSSSSATSSNLRRLWSRSDSRDRIAAIAAVELASWDGGHPDAQNRHAGGRAILVANMRTGFLGSSFDLSLALRPTGTQMNGRMEIFETAGKWSAIAFVPGAAGIWRTSYTEELDFGSILDGLVRIRHANAAGELEYKRYPRRIVPLIYDELQSAYVQADRLQLGLDSLLLVRTTGTSSVAFGTVEEVKKVLSSCARPGFETTTILDGLPAGWTLFTNVQMFTAPTFTKFNELIPLARNQLTVAGGLQIPSRIRKWSTISPPEIRATVQSERFLRVTLVDAENEELIHEWRSDSGTLVTPISGLGLQDGDYQVSLFTGSKTVPTQQASIRLRSGDAVDGLTWNRAPRLTYNLDTPRGLFTASEELGSKIVVDGLSCDGAANIETSCSAKSEISWNGSRTSCQRKRVSIGTPDPTSCVVTGAHHIKLPTWFGGASPKFIEGECTSCGLVKRFPGWAFSNRKLRKENIDKSPHCAITVAQLPPVAEATIEWDAALDALVHLGGGESTSLETVARQLQGSAIFVENFARALETLGHIAIERDPRGRAKRWELSPACLAQTASGQFRLTGGWTRPSISSIKSRVGPGVISRVAQENGPSERLVQSLSAKDLKFIAELEEAAIVPDSGAVLLKALPRLSDVGAAVDRISLPGFESAERFNLASATWIPTGDVSNAGAYRIKRGFEKLYIYRNEADVKEGSAAVAGPHLTKHLAANAIGKTLTFYLPHTEEILTPLGCQLPGLYDRAAVAFAGHLPLPSLVKVSGEQRRCLSYKSIDQKYADLLTTLLTT
ncbi:hypothetical protein [Rhodococcus sp. 852002-51564_SCH6189132-a]|uniref:hypothetical protein n=1 Tax=Rhodococcus sp. 852002-51564_SCH6189132-a TaxID=1834103 RepID=UPI0012E7D37A|nr:hypothetical protein [Rhodococcus sp. 852002-51564_SCH6189132-a]